MRTIWLLLATLIVSPAVADNQFQELNLQDDLHTEASQPKPVRYLRGTSHEEIYRAAQCIAQDYPEHNLVYAWIIIELRRMNPQHEIDDATEKRIEDAVQHLETNILYYPNRENGAQKALVQLVDTYGITDAEIILGKLSADLGTLCANDTIDEEDTVAGGLSLIAMYATRQYQNVEDVVNTKRNELALT